MITMIVIIIIIIIIIVLIFKVSSPPGSMDSSLSALISCPNAKDKEMD